MKLQPESKKELTHIACGVSILTVAMFVIFAALALVGWVKFDWRVVLGGVLGAGVAVGNFYGLCLMVQKAAAETDEKRRKGLVQLSYNTRMLIQAAWVIACLALPCFQFVAGAAPLLFPRITIYYLQITGHYQPPQPKGEDVTVEGIEDAAETPLADMASVEKKSSGEGGEN